MKFIVFILVSILITSCFGDFSNDTTIIRIKGSDTMLQLNKTLAEDFMKENPGISVYVDGGGTGTGVNALINNNIEICAASRPLEPTEIKQLGEQFSTVGMSFLIGRDALSIFINKENPVKDLTLDQINKIYGCEILNWEELGGENKPIQAITRSSASGTNLYFRKHVLQGEKICEKIPIANTTQEIIDFVKKNKNAIGYGGIGYADSTLQCSVNSIAPNRKNVLNNKYPISRYLRFYTTSKPKGNVKKFIDWVTSEKGQKIVEITGYVPLWQ